ncbi:MAG: hypothetical protein FJW30_24865 [Acidobacteria bacterium]|nr:hypothetical protein [Acidobacteriota bacterium]
MSIRTLLFHLPEDLANELRDTLIAARIVPSIEERVAVNEVPWTSFDIVFCPASLIELSSVLGTIRGERPPVVAVTRFPEDEEWIDALDLGAADYCAPPFEQSQLRWLFEKHLPSGTNLAA